MRSLAIEVVVAADVVETERMESSRALPQNSEKIGNPGVGPRSKEIAFFSSGTGFVGSLVGVDFRAERILTQPALAIALSEYDTVRLDACRRKEGDFFFGSMFSFSD